MNTTKQLTKAEAFALYNSTPHVAAIKDKTVLVRAVTEPYDYVTVVMWDDGYLVTENAGTAESGYIIRQLIPSYTEEKFVNEYVIRDEAELAKRYDLAEDQSDVPEGWTRYAPKAGAVKQVAKVHEAIEFPDPWAGNPFRLQAGGVLVDNGNGTVYGINPVEFNATHTILPFINLTPHAVGVLDIDGETVINVPPCGKPARVDYTDILASHVYHTHGGERIAAFNTVVRQYGEVTGLPPEGSLCVVSMPVAERCAGRVGVYYPDSGRDCIRDDKGQIVAVRRLVKAGAKETLGLDEEQIEALAMEAGFDVDDGEVLGGKSGSLNRFAKLIEQAIRA